MNIGIIGAGKIGGALGRVRVGQGRPVVFGSRNPAGGEIQSLLARAGNPARAASVAAAIGASDVVVFAIRGGAMAETVAQHAAALQGKIIIDATNVVGRGRLHRRFRS